jgi:predicted HD phosphohydrolase
MPNAALINEIEQLFARHGEQVHHQQGAESVTVLAHALHTAQLAEWADADEPLVAAALLHVLGRMLGESGEANDARAVEWLSEGFGDELVTPLRLQRDARRYLRAIEPWRAPTTRRCRWPSNSNSTWCRTRAVPCSCAG